MMQVRDQRISLLEGIRILDLADEEASFCTKLLADMGANVIKVERPGGDPSRKMGPFSADTSDPERSLFFLYHNTNKLGITLNLEHSEGRKIFRRLVEKVDVVVESFSPGYLKSLGLSFEILSRTNPKLILVSVTGFGQDGPRSQYKSCDLVASAFGGQMYVSGSPSTPPLKPFGEQSYYAASLFAAIGILLALRRRNRSGKGEHIDISLQEAVVSTLEHVMIQYFYEKTIPKRQGSLHWNNSFSILPCKDAHILMSLFQQWDTLVEWMDGEGMAEDLRDERYKEEEFRQSHLDHIVEVLQRWTETHTANELFELGQLMRFPWAPVYSPKGVLENPQLKARGFFVEVSHPELGTPMQYPGAPYKFDGCSLDRWKRAPLIGEDNRKIYQKELGLSEEELERLSSIRAI
jgi:crotonobetainyl-CoA:carnitine CoA-transferase CaiB-like acyl-CoA transferase